MNNLNYYVKAAYVAVITFLGALLAALQAAPEIGIGDLSTAAWITIVLATVVAAGGVLGLQAAPAKIATSVR